MTSASELFYQRRSRFGRFATTESELEPISSDRYHRRHHHSHSRHDFDGCDPLWRSPRIRNPCHRLSSISEQPGLFRVDQASSRVSFHGNDRLPGAVLLARARLVERLRGESISAIRRSTRVSLEISNRDYNQTERLQPIQEPNNKKPPGLTSEDINCLQLEIYNSLEEKGKPDFLSRDCSICLESFEEGDKLRHLQCDHRFHVACLDRWIQTCGDCPYCRRDIHICW